MATLKREIPVANGAAPVWQKLRDFGGFRFQFEVHSFDEGVRPLTLVGFRETSDGTAEGSQSSSIVVSVLAAHAGSSGQERARFRDVVV